MSGGKSLQDLIKEHKQEDEQAQKPDKSAARAETEDDKQQREARLKAMQSKLSSKARIDDRKVIQDEKESQFKSSEGKFERVREDRARKLLGKKNNIEDEILRKEEEERHKQNELKRQEDEMKLHRTDSQKERANQILNRFGDPNIKANQGNDSDNEHFDQVDPVFEFQQCIKKILHQEFINLNKDSHVTMIEDSDEEEKQDSSDDEIVKFIFEETGRCIKAHKCVLTSKLSLFESMFSGGMREGQTNKIEVYDSEYETYYAFLEYLYTGEINKLNSKYLIDLFELADKFCIDDLRDLIEDKLVENLDPLTIKDILDVAHFYKLNTLKHECWRYAKHNSKDLSTFGVFKQLNPEDVEQIKNIDKISS